MRNEEWETLVPGKDKLKFKCLPSAFGSITVRVINTRWGVLMKKSVLLILVSRTFPRNDLDVFTLQRLLSPLEVAADRAVADCLACTALLVVESAATGLSVLNAHQLHFHRGEDY